MKPVKRRDDITTELYTIAQELRVIATEGLRYRLNEFNERRYEKVMALSTRLIGAVDNSPPENIENDFRDNMRIQTPMIGVEAAVFKNKKLLLIKRHDDGLWAIPGGAADIGDTLAESALRELKEETKLSGSIKRLLGIFDSRIWKSKLKFQAFHVIFEIIVENSEPEKTIEAIDWGFFSCEELPELSPGHDTRVPFLFNLIDDETRIPYID